MTTKREEHAAFKKLCTLKGYISLELEITRLSNGDVTTLYKAYTSNPEPRFSISCFSPTEAVNDLINKVEGVQSDDN